jgi:drug/metabolite transporter (DMT)-like permease
MWVLMQKTQHATLIGGFAILLWSTLGLLTVLAGKIPPFQLLALTFSVSGILSLVGILWPGPWGRCVRELPWKVWGLGLWGLFGYHFFYFMALGNAPAVEANLINYLWPLLIVLFSGLLPGEQLRGVHLLGVGLGFAGAALLVKGTGSFAEPSSIFGFAMALMAALAWSSYSVLSRRFAHIPSDAVGGFCIATALLAWVCHGVMESWVMPLWEQWWAMAGLGLGPVGLAFFAWDRGMKHGNIQLLGTLAYFIPLFSTLFLIMAGHGSWSLKLMVSAGLIVGGAVVVTINREK